MASSLLEIIDCNTHILGINRLNVKLSECQHSFTHEPENQNNVLMKGNIKISIFDEFE